MAPSRDAPAMIAARGNPVATALAALGDGLRSRDFWLLAGSFFICGASTNGLIGTHLIPACVDHGIPEVTGASLLAMMGVFDFAGTTLSGWLSDRWSNRGLLAWYYGLRGLSLIYLPFAFGISVYGLPLFAVFYGLDWIATVPPTVRLAGRDLRFGARTDHVRLDRRGASVGRGVGGLWRGLAAGAVRQLSRSLHALGAALSRRGADGPIHRPPRHGSGAAGAGPGRMTGRATTEAGNDPPRSKRLELVRSGGFKLDLAGFGRAGLGQDEMQHAVLVGGFDARAVDVL